MGEEDEKLVAGAADFELQIAGRIGVAKMAPSCGSRLRRLPSKVEAAKSVASSARAIRIVAGVAGARARDRDCF